MLYLDNHPREESLLLEEVQVQHLAQLQALAQVIVTRMHYLFMRKVFLGRQFIFNPTEYLNLSTCTVYKRQIQINLVNKKQIGLSPKKLQNQRNLKILELEL